MIFKSLRIFSAVLCSALNKGYYLYTGWLAEHTDIVTQNKKDLTKYETEEKRIYLTQIYDLIPAELNKSSMKI